MLGIRARALLVSINAVYLAYSPTAMAFQMYVTATGPRLGLMSRAIDAAAELVFEGK